MTASRPDNEAIFHAARDIPDPDRRRGPGPGRLTNIHPFDWLEAQVLRREAEETLKIKRTP